MGLTHILEHKILLCENEIGYQQKDVNIKNV